MATRRDLLESAAHDRRRLTAAFGPRSPGGGPAEPTRPGRSLVAGLAVAVLVVGGAAVAGVLSPGADVDWTSPVLVEEQGSGALYVNLAPADGGAPELHRVTDLTSARLLLGDVTAPVEVSREAIAARDPQDTIGILGAPPVPPAVEDLVASGWTGCAGAGAGATDGARSGTRLRLADDPAVTATPGGAVLVRARGRLWLVAESLAGGDGAADPPRATAYEVPDEPGTDGLLAAVAGLSRADAVEVDDSWLALLPRGDALDLAGFDLDGLGDPVPDPAATGLPGSPRVGDLVETDDGDLLVLTGPALMRLDPFGAAVYRSATRPDGAAPRTFRVDRAPALTQRDTEGYADNGWPRDVVAEADRGRVVQPCVVLDTTAALPGARLATVDGPVDTTAGATDVPAGETVAGADPGHGALVREGDWDEPETDGDEDAGDTDEPAPVTLVDDLGRAYPVADETALANLGYADVDPVVVPAGWLAVLTEGPTLSVEAARCPPRPESPSGGCR